MDVAVLTAGAGIVSTAITAVGGWLLGARKHKAEAAKLKAEAEQTQRDAVTRAHEAIQDSYQDLIADMDARVKAVAQEAATARSAAHEAREHARKAEENAWLADMRARSMERFLAELRPLIATYVPDAESILERMDKLIAARP